jgi:hypothetical protein
VILVRRDFYDEVLFLNLSNSAIARREKSSRISGGIQGDNIVAIPLAAGILALAGIVLSHETRL